MKQMKSAQRIATVLLAVILSTVMLHAQEKQDAAENTAGKAPSVEEIVQKTNWRSYYQGADGRARVKMTITDAQDRVRNREFTILRKDMTPDDMDDREFIGEQRFYVYFHRPADVNNMVYMVWKHIDSDDDRWLYLPALDLVKRIAASDKRTSFVGSHFFYEDVSGRSIQADHHELDRTTDDYFVLKNTPKDTDLVEFKYFLMWIHKDSFIAVKTEYYDKNDRKYREYQALEVKEIDGFKTVTKASMKDLNSGGHTLLEYTNVEYNLEVPDDVFTERYLRRPPRQYLR